VIILVVAAHPDDEVLGCGGTIAWHTARGDRAAVLILGEGITARSGVGKQGGRAMLAELKDDAKRAADALKVAELFMRDFPDNQFDSVPLLRVVKAIEEVKHQVQPDIVYTHHWGDLNIDHRLTCDAVLATFRPLPSEKARELWAFEVPSASGWSAPSASNAFVPNAFVDITATLDQKLVAMKSYRGEMRDYPHPRSSEALTALARYRGAQAGVLAAEALVLMRLVRD